MTPKELIAEARRRSGPSAALFQDIRGLLGDLADALEASEAAMEAVREAEEWNDADFDAVVAQRDAAIARADKAEADRDEAQRERLSALAERDDAWRENTNPQVAAERDAAFARAGGLGEVVMRLTDERDRLLNERHDAIARAEKAERFRMINGFKNVVALEEERDAAIASAAAMRAALEKIGTKVAEQTDDEDLVCRRCGDGYHLGDGLEPTPYCNGCAHALIEAHVEIARAALRDTAGGEKT
jgi:hypothetical protein